MNETTPQPADKPKRFWAPLVQVGTPNLNGRIYPQPLMEREIDRIKPTCHNHSLMGEAGQYTGVAISLLNASHFVTDFKIYKGELFAEIELMNTPSGKAVQEMLKIDDDAVRFAIRGIGSVTPGPDSVLTVDDNFRLITIDAILDHKNPWVLYKKSGCTCHVEDAAGYPTIVAYCATCPIAKHQEESRKASPIDHEWEDD